MEIRIPIAKMLMSSSLQISLVLEYILCGHISIIISNTSYFNTAFWFLLNEDEIKNFGGRLTREARWYTVCI